MIFSHIEIDSILLFYFFKFIEHDWNYIKSKSLSFFTLPLFHAFDERNGDYALQFLSSSSSTVHFRCFEHRRSDLVKDASSWVRSFGFFMGGLRSIMLVPWLIDWFAVRSKKNICSTDGPDVSSAWKLERLQRDTFRYISKSSHATADISKLFGLYPSETTLTAILFNATVLHLPSCTKLGVEDVNPYPLY